MSSWCYQNHLGILKTKAWNTKYGNKHLFTYAASVSDFFFFSTFAQGPNFALAGLDPETL